MQTEYFSTNLRRLILEKHTNLSNGAQAIGINRQQLNKYLKGVNQPSVEILKKMASALGVTIDMLLLPPAHRHAQNVNTPPTSDDLNDKFIGNYKQLCSFSQANHEMLRTNCGNYLIYHSSDFLKDHILIGYSQIYQHKHTTYMSTLMNLDREGRSPLLPRLYRYDAIVLMNSGCLHCVRINSLAGPDTDLGLMIFRPKRIASEKHLFGHGLTTGLSEAGTIAHSAVVLEQIHGRALSVFRRHCGLRRSDDNRLTNAVRDHFNLQ
ncbi:helix-turn-helix transcriptional regulator [Celeribacter halophilus]|uniref:Helix-turn-helix transcriptional regulator n=1 Tax=Celeribacter halophilus TaxID=576117 RepID=A0AAW7XQR3_9RHOB|nr:helix-turn-helix transcriptional regulator [Celeribacter halophilus]MDO6456776.1 helix-turn-helix transcriptional regulator [Celeribacter halophilus]